MSGQSKHGLLENNVKTGKYLPGGWQEQISYTFLDLKLVMLHGINPFKLFFLKW